jgi:DNA-binding NarL/FixJ family response regulator
MSSKAAAAAVGPGKARVLIVDDHPVVREGLALLISAQPDLEVCGEAEDVASACRLLDEARPDVVVVDISLPGGGGLELIKRIRAHRPTIRMLVSSIHEEGAYAERALRAGALGYINKREATRTLLDAIRRVRDGHIYLSEQMTDRLLSRAVAGGEPAVDGSSVDSLSDRELDVFESIGRGESTREIADRLHLSGKTVETYRERIRKKLGLKTGGELARRAMEWVLGNA